MARLFDSEPPPVKTIRRGFAPMRAATWRRAAPRASRARRPGAWRLEGFPQSSPSQGSIASRTASATRVVALLSR